MADKDDCPPFRLQLAHQGKQIFDLRGRQHGGRLVEDQDVGAPIEETQDLDDLAHVDRRVRSLQPPVDRSAGEGSDPIGLGLGPAPVDEAAERRRLARED